MADGTMTARQLAQNYYNQLAAAPVFGGSPFAPSRLGNMNWLEPITNINMFRARDAQWEQQGQTWPDDDPRWIILGRQPARALTRSHNEMQQGFYRPLNNANRAERWGRSIFTLAHELGHNNWSGGTGTYVEPNADWYAKQNFRSTARSLGFHRPQIRNMWQANNGFAGIKEPPK